MSAVAAAAVGLGNTVGVVTKGISRNNVRVGGFLFQQLVGRSPFFSSISRTTQNYTNQSEEGSVVTTTTTTTTAQPTAVVGDENQKYFKFVKGIRQVRRAPSLFNVKELDAPLVPLKPHFRPIIKFPNIRMTLITTGGGRKKLDRSHGKSKLLFKTTPNLNKFDIKGFLHATYNFNVEKVNTMNVEKRRQPKNVLVGKRHTKIKVHKKAIVTLKPAPPTPYESLAIQEVNRVLNRRVANKLDILKKHGADITSLLPKVDKSLPKVLRSPYVQLHAGEIKKELKLVRKIRSMGLLDNLIYSGRYNKTDNQKKIVEYAEQSLYTHRNKERRKWWTIREK